MSSSPEYEKRCGPKQVWLASLLGLLVVLTALVWPSSNLISPQADTTTGLEAPSAGPGADQVAQAAALDAFAKLPVRFEQNVGQADPAARFLARSGASTLFLTPGEAVLALSPEGGEDGARLGMSLVGADPEAEIVASEPFAAATNYFVGDDPEKWRTDVPTYGRVTYRQVYPGVDLVYHGANDELEFDLVVAPGADPKVASLAYTGASHIALDGAGDLLLTTGATTVRQRRPLAYQDGPSGRQIVAADYQLGDDSTVGLRLGDYDRFRPLVIDPVIEAGRFLSGGGGRGDALVMDEEGNAYVVFDTNLEDGVPTPDGFDTGYNGGTTGGGDAFVVKLDPQGGFTYGSYLGGVGIDRGLGIDVDIGGNIYVTGTTSLGFATEATENNFPVVNGLPQACPIRVDTSAAFVSKLDPSRTGTDQLQYSTCLAGSGGTSTNGQAITADSRGSAYVTGGTDAPDFPVTDGSALGRREGGFVTRLDTMTGGQGSLAYSTVDLGSRSITGSDIEVDPPGSPDAESGNVYVTGTGDGCGGGDAFVSKLSSNDGNPLLYSACLGGLNGQGQGIAVDDNANVYVVGLTSARDFGVTPNAYQTTSGGGGDAFVAKFDTKLDPATGPVYATYLGGQTRDLAKAVAVDQAGAIYITGQTAGGLQAFPSKNPLPSEQCGGGVDGFLAKINPDLSGEDSLVYSLCFGGAGGGADDPRSVGVASDGQSIWVAGSVGSSDFPIGGGRVGGGGGQSSRDNMFIIRFAGQPPLITASVADPSGSVLGGKAVEISGSGFTAGSEVTFGDVPAAQVVVNGENSITATSPPRAQPGPVDLNVVVTNFEGVGEALAGEFAYRPALRSVFQLPIPAFSRPGDGRAKPGETVVISGQGFANAIQVSFGGTPVMCPCEMSLSPEADEIRVVLPERAPGTVKVTVDTAEEEAIPVEPDADLFTIEAADAPGEPIPPGSGPGEGPLVTPTDPPGPGGPSQPGSPSGTAGPGPISAGPNATPTGPASGGGPPGGTGPGAVVVPAPLPSASPAPTPTPGASPAPLPGATPAAAPAPGASQPVPAPATADESARGASRHAMVRHDDGAAAAGLALGGAALAMAALLGCAIRAPRPHAAPSGVRRGPASGRAGPRRAY